MGRFAQYFNRSPAQLGPEQIRQFQVHLVCERKVSWSTFKGNKQRLSPMSPRLLETLRQYWIEVRPTLYLFPGKTNDQPLSSTVIQKGCKQAACQAGLNKRVTPHTFRHSYATGLLEAGVDLLTIGQLLGHRSLSSTLIYLHVRRPHLISTPSPLDWLPVEQCPQWARPQTQTPSPPESPTTDHA